MTSTIKTTYLFGRTHCSQMTMLETFSATDGELEIDIIDISIPIDKSGLNIHIFFVQVY